MTQQDVLAKAFKSCLADGGTATDAERAIVRQWLVSEGCIMSPMPIDDFVNYRLGKRDIVLQILGWLDYQADDATKDVREYERRNRSYR